MANPLSHLAISLPLRATIPHTFTFTMKNVITVKYKNIVTFKYKHEKIWLLYYISN